MKQLYITFAFLCLSFTSLAGQITVSTSDDNNITVTRYDSQVKDKVFIWLPGEDGFQNANYQTAKFLSKFGEVWLPELFESRFLPAIPSSISKIPATDITALIQSATSIQNKKVILIGSDRGIIPLLTGVNLWQSMNVGNNNLVGIILISPNFFVRTPNPGDLAELLPIINNTNLTVFLIQPKQSPWYWKLQQSINALQKSGSDVYLQIIPKVRDRFYYRPDATLTENHHSELLSNYILKSSRLLFRLPIKVRAPSRHPESAKTPRIIKKENTLKPYTSKADTPQLRLKSLAGKESDLINYRNKVVLVNFWASWCPPCVHEMPSMQRLQNMFETDTFTILGVNMAEDTDTIKHFLSTKINVTFPILLDSDGTALKSWQVFAFPTSYLIDKKGKIRYALFGSVEWDSKDKIKIIKSLIDE